MDATRKNKVLEINLVSAQGLKTPSNNLRRRVQTYAVAWVNSSSKLRTRIDSLGGQNPTWNDKFLFRVSQDFVSGDTSAVSVEIYAVGYVTDFLIGTVRFLLSNCLNKNASVVSTPSITAVQVRRPSGRFQGMLNIAAAVYEDSDFAIMENKSAVCLRDIMGKIGSGKWKLSRGGSKRSSGGESCDFSDGSDSTTTTTASSPSFNEMAMAGKKKVGVGKSNSFCGLVMRQKRMMIPFCPSDQNLHFWADHDSSDDDDNSS